MLIISIFLVLLYFTIPNFLSEKGYSSAALHHTNTYCTSSTLQGSQILDLLHYTDMCALYRTKHLHTSVYGLQTLDPFTVMQTYTDLCLAHPLESWTPFDIEVNLALAFLTKPVTS